jgi:hypothetical protein
MDFGKDKNLIFTTPSGLWIIIDDCAYKLKDPKIENFNFDYGRKTEVFKQQLGFVGSCSTNSMGDLYDTPIGCFVKYEDDKPDVPKKVSISVEITSDTVETAHIDKLHQIFSSEDIKEVSKIMCKKFDSMGADEEDES